MPNKIDALYSEVSKSYEVGSIDDFKKYLADPKKRQLFFKEIIAPEYDVKSIDDFDEAYGFKKKSTESPSQGAQKDIFSVSGETPKAGPSEPSARKRYDVSGQKVETTQPTKPVAQLTQRDIDMMMPFMGTPAQTNVIGEAPVEQPNPFAEDVKKAANILTKKSPEGDAFTAGIIKNKPESKAYAKEVLTAIEGPKPNSYIDKIVYGSVAAGTLADKVASLNEKNNADDIDFEEIASLNKIIQDNAIEDEGGIVGFIKNIPNVLASSLISMGAAYKPALAGAGTGAVTGSAFPVIGTAAGAAAGFAGGSSLALEYSSSLMASLRDAGIDITSEEDLKSAFSNPEKIKEARSYALKRGIPVALFDMASGGLAGKIGKTTAKSTAKEIFKEGAKETAVQAVLGGAGEATAQILADGKLDGRQIAYEMVAEPVSAIPSSAINYFGDKAKTVAEKKYVERLATDADLKVKSDIAMVVNPEIAASTKKINEYRKLKEEAVSQTAKDEYDRIIAQEREKKYTAYDNFFPEFDSMSEEKKQAAYTLLEDINKTMAEYNAAESPAEKKILGQVLSNKVKQLKGDAVQEQTTSEVPVQSGAQGGQEVVEGKPQPEPQVFAEEGKEKVVIPAGKRLFNEPNPETVEISKTYKEKNNIVEPEGVKIEAVDVDNASKIADAYEALQDTPNDPEVQDAYNAMADETAKQHQDIVDAGYEVEIWQGEGEPYANAQEMIDDVKNNKHMFIYSTEQGFGDEPITEEQRKQNKLLQDSGFKDKTGKPLLYNDLFRFVHDFFGHTERGNGFGPVGEENAWDVHARMYTPKARRAMTTETRGQNSWVNFGPQMRNADGSLMKKGDQGYLSPQDRKFAPQKMALMPEEFSQITEVVSNFDQALANSAQSLNVVAPGLKMIVGENIDDVQNQIVEAIAPLIGERQAVQTAEEFATGTKGQTIFVDGKPFAVVFDKTTADSRTAGHEAWEVMLNDAFGNDQAKFKEFTVGIDSQLRAQGFGDIADALDAFASQRGYEAVKYSEYMAELGGMLVEAGFGKGPLTAQQKTLLQKIGDIINKFAELFTGKKQFLDQATPEDILGFMVTISEKVAKGEDVASFFRPTENTETIKDTKKVLTNRSQKIGDFDIQYFEDEAQFKDLVDRGLVVQNASIDEAAGQPVATHQPDNLLVGNVNYKGKQIMEGNGGIYYVLKFGNVWASGKQNSAKNLANYINKSRKESTDGIGRMVLVRGSQDKMISSVQGVKAAMRILEELVFDNLISTSDFRKALTAAGKAYNIDFSGSNSAKQIQKDIEGKFMNVSDSTFSDRGDFFSTLVNEIGKLDSAKKNIKEIQKALGATKNIQFSKEGIRKQIGTVLTERLLIGLDSGNAYAMVEVDEDVVVKKDDQHPSYPFSIVTKSGKPPVLKVFNYRPKAVEAITTMSGEKASNAQLGFAQRGMGMGRIASDKEIVVKSRSQKNVPAVVDEVLTDDGKGNYLFVHYSDDTRDVIKPMSGSKRNFTSKEEVSAISSVGGVAMYYTKAGQKENGVGDVPHTVLVPKDKVYFYGTTDKGTVSHDPEGFEAEARQRFQEYKNRGNEKNPTIYAFDSNNSAAWVTKVAGENGYDMVVTNWGGPKSYRAQTTKTLKAEDEYTGFKKPEPVVFEVGDEIFVSGSYGNVTAVNGSTVRYEGTNQYGDPTSGVFDLNRNINVIMIEKAKPSVTTRSQKVEVKTIPGYDRFIGVIEGMIDKGMNSGTSYNKITANVIEYIQRDSAVYERADDSQREQIIRDFVKIRGEKFKVAPSVAKILGQIEDVKKVTVKESTALKDQIKLEVKAAKDSAAFVKQLRMDISGRLKSMVGRGMMSARQATAIISRYDKMNILNPVMRDRFVDYMSRVFQSAEYMDKIKEASKLRASIKKNMKSAANQAEIAKLAKDFGDIDPSRVENIDDYINNATQMLNAVARKTGDPLMRSLVNAADMASYVETEIDLQKEQIKNELLDKYKELVDAGVLSSDMTINEIKKVVAAIEENDNEAVAKEEKARASVKEMMEEVSPLILQIVKTGEDPFTGEPITLTQDEKRSLVALAKMDTDSLSLSSAIQVLEYANNFVANGITSGIDGMVSLYQGDLNAGDLVDDGIKSIPLSKYFSKAVGKVWGEGFATLPMLNKLLWGNTRRAIMVSEKAGINGVSNGKAKALKMVDTAVKQYVKQFSKVKDFLASENVVERGVFAFMSRNVIGDEFQAQDEFNRRKTLIEETIQALTDVDNNTDAEIKKGEVIQKVYDKVLKDAKNIDDVKKNVSQINQDAVNWWINKWSENFDRLDEVSRNVYNTQLSRDIDFTPDRFQLKEAPTATEEDFDSGFFGNFENVDTSKSGSLRKNNRIANLPKDKNGIKTRIVNLDFDVNNVNAFTNAMVDVETASSVMQMKGFVTSKNFSKLFSNKEDKNLYKKRLIKYVNRAKGGSYVDQNELAKANRIINTIASFGVAKALFSVSQPFKQFFPPMMNTFVQTGRFDLNKLLYGGGMGFIDSSGYPIANRGVASQGELKSINRQLVEAEKNLAMRGLDGVAEFSNKALEITLKNPDIFAARASWLSFYLSKLKKDGVNISGIDFKNHEINKKAADYAQAMVDSQQNISDTDMQGEIFASKQPATVFLRRAILPLMTFTLNQKTRIWSDIRTITNNVSSIEDKSEAGRSLGGAVIELVAFQGIALAFKELYNVVAAAIMGEDEDEEQKKIRKMRQAQSTAQAFMKDFFLPPIPGMDIAASKGINYLLDETGLSDELPYKWYGIEDEEQKFRLYDKMNQGYLDMLGTQGIAAEKALELIEYYDAAIDGEFTKEYNGNKVKKALMEEDLDIARMNAVIMTAYYGGLLPSDMANIVNIMNKKIQKRAEQVDED